jgi:threonine/homoserine/homoserine lactone efflux protein
MSGTGAALVLAGLGIGIGLASAPGPVQAVLLAEAVRGGLARGFHALAGANLAFELLLVCLALGLALVPPAGTTLGILQLAGGAFLLWLAADGFASGRRTQTATQGSRTLPPSARGALAVLINPGAWLFLGAVASPLLASAAQRGGTGGALVTGTALMAGSAVGDAALVLLGTAGIRRAGTRTRQWVTGALAAVLAGLGVWLLATGVISLAAGRT